MSLRPKYYPTLDECIANDPYSGQFDLFESTHFFDGTLQYKAWEIQTDVDGGRKKVEVTKNLPDLGFDSGSLLDYFVNHYGEKELARALVPENGSFNSTSWENEWTWLYKRINFLVNANSHKYIRLVASLDFSYDPISNYDMMEVGKDKNDLGEKYTERTGNNSREITSTTVVPNADVTIVNTSEGQDKNFVPSTVGTGGDGDTVTTTADSNNKPTTINSVTTYDDDNPVTLNKSESTGTSITTNKQDPKFSSTITTGARGWKDTTLQTIPSNDYHNLNRQGNIGVTTTQEMIQKEREIARYSVIEEFFNDLKNECMLSTWR